MDFRFVAYNPQTSTKLYQLPRANFVQIGDTFGTRGTLELKYSTKALGARELPTFLEVQAEATFDGGHIWAEVGPRLIRLTGEHEDTDASGMRTLRFVGREWTLDKARVGAGDGDGELIDGKRAFYQATPGQIMSTLLLEAQDRGAAQGIELSGFTNSKDTAGNTWSKKATIYYSPGLPIGSVLENLVEQGLCDYRLDGRTLNLYEPETEMGRDLTDRANPVRVHSAVTEAPVKYSLEDLASAALLIGDEGFELEVENPSAPDDYGRLEVTIEQGGVSDAGTARLMVDEALQRGSREIKEITRSQSAAGAAFLPYRDYRVGDYVQVLDGGNWERYRVREIQLVRDGQEWTIHTVINDRLQELLLKLAKRTSGIVNGSTGSGGDGTRPAPADKPGIEPAAPEGLVIDQQVYLDRQGIARGQITAGWGAVTESTKGTSVEIGGYELWWRRNETGAVWTRATVTTGDLSVSHSPVVLSDGDGNALAYQWRVRAIASASSRPGPFSPPVTLTMAQDTEPPAVPSLPAVATDLRIITVEWNGLDEDGEAMPVDFNHARIYFATAEDMAGAQRVGSLTQRGMWNSGSMDPDVPVWVAVSAVDNVGNESAMTPAQPLTPRKLVDDDSIRDAVEGIDDKIDEAVADLNEAINNIVIDANGTTTYWMPTEPDETTDPAPKAGDLWFDTSEAGKNELHRFDGQKWVSAADRRIRAMQDAQEQFGKDITEAEQRAIDEASELANAAKDSAEATASADATGKANAARDAAVSAAKTEAEGLAKQALEDAIVAAESKDSALKGQINTTIDQARAELDGDITAAQARADAAFQDAADADSRAEAAQARADLANDRAEALVLAGNSIIPNGDFENASPNIWPNTAAQSGISVVEVDHARSGTHVMRMDSSVANRYPLTDWRDSAARRTYYAEVWVYHNDSDMTTRGRVSFYAQARLQDGSEPGQYGLDMEGNTVLVYQEQIPLRTWTKVSAYITTPEETLKVRVSPHVLRNETPFDFDDFKVIDVTESLGALRAARSAQSEADQAKTAASAAQSAADTAQATATAAGSTASLALNSANSKNRITRSTSTPPTQYDGRVDDIWWVMSSLGSGGRVLSQWRWNGVVWVSELVGSEVIAYLDAAKVTVGEMDGARIKAGTLYADRIISGLSQNMVPDPGFMNADINANRIARSSPMGGTWSIADGVVVWSPLPGPVTNNANFPLAATDDLRAWPAYSGMSIVQRVQVRAVGGSATIRGTLYMTKRDGSRPYSAMAPTGFTPITSEWVEYVFTYTLDPDVIGYTTALQVGSSSIGRVEFRAPFVASTVGGTLIENGAVTTDKVAANAIEASKIKAGAIGTVTLAADAVTAAKVQAGAIGAQAIAAGSIEAKHITTSKLLADAVLVSSSVGSTLIQDGAITTDKIAVGAITADSGLVQDLDAGTIKFGEMDGARIKAGTVDADRVIVEGSVGATLIEDGAVTTDKILANAITAGKIAASAIEADHIAANAITADKIKAGAIDGKLITGATIRTAASGRRTELDVEGLRSYDSSGKVTLTTDTSDGSIDMRGILSQTISGVTLRVGVGWQGDFPGVQWSDSNIYNYPPGVGLKLVDGSTTKKETLLQGPGVNSGNSFLALSERGEYFDMQAWNRSGSSRTSWQVYGSMTDNYMRVGNGDGAGPYMTFKRGTGDTGQAWVGYQHPSNGGYASLALRDRYIWLGSYDSKGEVVSRLWGDAESTELTAGARDLYLRGKDIVISPSGTTYLNGDNIRVNGNYPQGSSYALLGRENGRLVWVSSSRRYKLLEEPIEATMPDFEDKILSIDAKTWFPKQMAERVADYKTSIANGETPAEELEDLSEIRRSPGVIAEDLDDVGLGMFVVYDKEGRPETVMNDRIGPALIPIIRRLRDRVDALEQQLGATA